VSEQTPADTYRALSQPPKWALRQIQAGRLRGKTDINPQWRIQAMTETFGACGVGWRYEVANKWTEPGPDGQIFAFADVNVYIRVNGEWSEPIPGTGGNMLVDKESKGLHANDEAYKMAVTDALSSALKMLGVAADIYAGAWDGSKYRKQEPALSKPLPDDAQKSLREALTAAQTTAEIAQLVKGPSYQQLQQGGPEHVYREIAAFAKLRHSELKGK